MKPKWDTSPLPINWDFDNGKRKRQINLCDGALKSLERSVYRGHFISNGKQLDSSVVATIFSARHDTHFMALIVMTAV